MVSKEVCFHCDHEMKIRDALIDCGPTWNHYRCPTCNGEMVSGWLQPKRFIEDALNGKLALRVLPLAKRGEPRTPEEIAEVKRFCGITDEGDQDGQEQSQEGPVKDDSHQAEFHGSDAGPVSGG